MKAAAAILVLVLTGCTLAPRNTRPALPVPALLPQGDAYAPVAETAPRPIAWRDVFRDSRLQAVIEQALTNNRDLRIAAANIEVARARYRIERAALLPQIEASGGATFRGGDGNAGQARSSYGAEVAITSFEIDLFGRLRSLSAAAQQEFLATESAARATRLALIGDIATAWIDYAADASLLAIAERTAASAERSVALTRARLEGGVAARTDLRQAETILAQARSDLAAGRTALAQDVNLLQLLVGSPVDPALLPDGIEAVGASVLPLAAGRDSRVLLARPDVMRAEHMLYAANGRIGAARVALFPRVSLSALAGFASNALDTLFRNGSYGHAASPEISQSIFAGGALAAGVKEARAQREIALASYELAIQTAFREAADVLAREGTIAEQIAADSALVAAAEDSARLADARYRGGVDAYLQLLDAQRTLYNAERSLVGTWRERAVNRATLFRALGGDETVPEG